MLFGHTYNLRIEAKLSNNTIAKAKVPVEARFVTSEELISLAKKAFEKEVKWKYGLDVEKYIKIYDASELKNGGNIKDKRYAVTTDMYAYAPDDESVIKQAKDFVGDLRNKLDNQAEIKDITEVPFGSLKTRQLQNVPKYKNGGDIDDFENMPEIDLGVNKSKNWIKLWEDFKRQHKLKVELPHKDPQDRGEESDNAYFMLRHIIKIKRGDWKPNWNDPNQQKCYPWFWMDDKHGFAFYDTYCDNTYSGVAARLCFPTPEMAEATAKEFLPIYKVFMTENFSDGGKIMHSAGGKLGNTEYTRVIPRDLFNESKLLKCVGRLILLIHNNTVPVEMSFEENGDPFEIALMDEGSLTITNIKIFIKDKPYIFKTTYNSKINYPFFVQDDNYTDYSVFDEKGDFDEEFIEFCKTVK